MRSLWLGIIVFTTKSVACSDDCGSSKKFVETKFSTETTVLSSASNSDAKNGFIVDARDGRTYRVVNIGGMEWMAQNLNYKTKNSYCYNDSAKYCEKYGRLYELPSPSRICPDGWHLPSSTEWGKLFRAAGGFATSAKILKSKSGWKKDGNGTDAVSFSILPAGFRNSSGTYEREGELAGFLNSTQNGPWLFNERADDAFEVYGLYGNSFSVRCLKDYVKSPMVYRIVQGTMIDSRDGQTYKTVKIVDQVWMAENLKYKMENSLCFDKKESNCNEFGRLYMWADAMKACPAGWHLPSQAEWKSLLSTVAGETGNKLKAVSSWLYDDGTDDVSFSAIPTGYCVYYERKGDWSCNSERAWAYFWGSQEFGRDNAQTMELYFDSDYAKMYTESKSNAYAVRCLKD